MPVAQGISDRFWQAEASTEETKQFILDIKRIARRKFSAEVKIRIVLEGFQRDTPNTPIRDLCCREGTRRSTYYAWFKGFMEASRERFTRDKMYDATRESALVHVQIVEGLRTLTVKKYRLAVVTRGSHDLLSAECRKLE